MKEAKRHKRCFCSSPPDPGQASSLSTCCFSGTTHVPCGCPFHLYSSPHYRLQVTACEIYDHPLDGSHFMSILMEQKKYAFILISLGKYCHLGGPQEVLSTRAEVLKDVGSGGRARFLLKSSRTEEKSLTRRPRESAEGCHVSETVFREL